MLIVISLLFGFVATEFVFRAYFYFYRGPDFWNQIKNYAVVNDPKYGFKLRPNLNTVELTTRIYDKFLKSHGDQDYLVVCQINEDGFRGCSWEESKKPGTLRIACFGGSTTFGHCVDDRETWPAQLAQLLNEKICKCEIMNFGVPGWDSSRDRDLALSVISKYNPDVLLFHEGWNDEFLFSLTKGGNLNESWSHLSAEETFNYYGAIPFAQFLSRFATFFVLAKAIRRRRVFASRMNFGSATRWRGLIQESWRKSWASNVSQVVKAASKRGAVVALIDYPGLVSLHDAPDDREEYIANTRMSPLHAEYQALSKSLISSLMRQLGPKIPVLDGSAGFDMVGPERLEYFLDDIHLSGKGNGLLAKLIVSDLLDLLSRKEEWLELQVSFPKSLKGVGSCSEYQRLVAERRAAELARASDEKFVPDDMYTTV